MSTRGYQFISFIQRSEVRSADYEILLIQAQVAAIRNWIVWGSLLQDLPSDLKIYFGVLQLPNMFAKFGIEFVTQVIKRSFVVGGSSLEGVFSKSHVGLIRPVVLRRDSRLVHH